MKEKSLGLVAILAIAIAGFAVLGSVTYWNKLTALHAHELAAARAQNEQRVQQLTEAAAQQFDGTVRSVDTALLYLRDVYAKDRAGFERAVRIVLTNYPPDMLGEVVVVGPDGNVGYSSQAGVHHQYLGGQEHFLVHAQSQQDQLFIGRAAAEGGARGHLVPLSRPIFQGQLRGQRLLGVISIAVRPQYFADKFSALQVSPQDLLALVRSDGSFIARNQNLAEALETRLPPGRPFLAASAGAGGIFRDMSTVDQVPLLFSWRRLSLWPVSVVVAIDERSALELVNTRHSRELERALVSIAVMLAAAVGVALLLLRLARRNAQLGESESRFRRFFEKNGSVMLLVEPVSGRIVDANAAAAQLYGYPLDALRGMPIADINMLSADQVASEMRRATLEERNYFNFSHRLAGGEVRDVEVYSTPISVQGQAHLFSIVNDISKRRSMEAERKLLAMAVEQSPASIVVAKPDGRIAYVNDAFCNTTGYSRAEVLGSNPRILKSGYTTAVQYQDMWDTLLRGEAWKGTFQNVRKDGSVYWESAQISPVLDADGRVTYYLGIKENITERKQLETRLQLAASVFTHAREGIMITDAAGTIVDVNGTFSQITGYSYQEVVGQNPRILQSGRQGAEFYQSMWKSMLEKGHWQGEVWNRRKSGEVYAEMQTVSAVRDGKGDIQHYVALFSDITPLKRHQQELEHIAHFDALTQLPNRVLLADRLQQGIVQCQRRKQSLAVVFLDLDGFKSVNDAYGHAAGDTLLIEVSQRIKAALREGDTLSRIGGDEFVAILADLENVRSCEPVLWRMLQAASSPVLHGAHVLQVTASMGVTLYPQDGVDADLLMRHADQAMYTAKQAGKNRYHVFDIVQDVAIRNRRESLERIRRAVVAGEFVLHYQPKVNLRTAKVVGLEALIRWQHPEHGLLLPHDFLPEMEDHPGSVDIGEWVLDTALRQIGAWQTQGQILPVSVNIGAYQLQCADFVERLRQLLQKHAQVPPEHLQIEVLETSALQDMARVGETMLACKAIGVNFALDDFGTGYSSLTYLKHLPAHTLKIDQSFVRDMLTDESDLAIVNGIIGLAAAFGREVIAEGVETRAHGELLLSLGCALAQGFGIARPMPVEAVGDWLMAWDSDAVWTA